MILFLGGVPVHVSALFRPDAAPIVWTVTNAAGAHNATGYTLSLPVTVPPPRRRFGEPRDFSQPVRAAAGLSVAARHSGVSGRWRPLPVRLVPRVVRRQSRLA